MQIGGHDTALRTAAQELGAGHWMSMRGLLATTDVSRSWATWTYRSQVLAAAAAGSNIVETWHAEAPDVTSVVMTARVTTERALRARTARHPDTHALWHTAMAKCRAAVYDAPDNPVPWICFLALAVIDEGQQEAEHRVRTPDPMLPPGPWGLLQRAHHLDPYNREAYHRMLQYWLSGAGTGTVATAEGYARWALSWAEQPAGAALLMLPVYVRLERWLRQPRDSLDMHWLNPYAIQDATTALDRWFALTAPADQSVQDLNYLAHALWAGQQYTEAAPVFEAMGRHITPRPWSDRLPESTDAELHDFIARARARCLTHAAGKPPPRRAGTPPAHSHRPFL